MKPVDLLEGTHSLLADRVRLAIMATLAGVTEPMDFNTLLQSLRVTRGNLSSHVRKLEQGGLLTVTKGYVGRKPRTTYQCTDLGRREVRNYLEKVEALLRESTKRT
jgi:DNA-binding HxlR family transcriptional regulator